MSILYGAEELISLIFGTSLLVCHVRIVYVHQQVIPVDNRHNYLTALFDPSNNSTEAAPDFLSLFRNQPSL